MPQHASRWLLRVLSSVRHSCDPLAVPGLLGGLQSAPLLPCHPNELLPAREELPEEGPALCDVTRAPFSGLCLPTEIDLAKPGDLRAASECGRVLVAVLTAWCWREARQGRRKGGEDPREPAL